MAITMNYLYSLKLIKNQIKSPIQQSHLMFKRKNMFTPTQNPIMLEIANNGPFLPFQLIL
jgi:hypothetical protein